VQNSGSKLAMWRNIIDRAMPFTILNFIWQDSPKSLAGIQLIPKLPPPGAACLYIISRRKT
jgi:hypothetical protein